MIRKNSHGIYQSSLLSDRRVVHGYSTRHAGDMRDVRNRKTFLAQLDLAQEVTMPQQVHGINIEFVDNLSLERNIAQSDGLVSKGNGIGILTADCVPLLAIDLSAHVTGIIHAGGRGTLKGIVTNLINSMIHVGANEKNILVSIGPYIGMCCYEVGEDRAMAFIERFGDNKNMVSKGVDRWYLDIGYANYLQLVDGGLTKEHIDMAMTCTSCQVSEFFSYRKDTKETFGEQMATIGFSV